MPLRAKSYRGVLCAVADCERKAYGRGWCRKHYRRWRHNGDPLICLTGPRGQGSVDSHGYRRFKAKNNPNANGWGYILEHRLVMTGILGRPLLSNENVHHKNGNRLDNRPANLELWISSQPRGQRVEDLVAWAEDIIFRYGKAVVQLKLLTNKVA